MLMDAWDEERSRILALEKEVKYLAKRKPGLKKERQDMLANNQDRKFQVAAREKEKNSP